jgi:hypothetical protein
MINIMLQKGKIMVDTIHFEIMNVSERYGQMIGYMNDRSKDKDYSVLDFKDHTSSKRLDIQKGKLYIPSSSREINYNWDKVKNKISFEFSVPKALYGTNVYQFVNHKVDRYSQFVLGLDCVMKNQVKKTHRRLIHFIKAFLQDQCLYRVVSEYEYRQLKGQDRQLHLISMQDIEVSRIDFCFNRIFNSRKDALDYLDLLKALHKQGQREGRNKSKFGYGTAVYLVGEYFTLKVYHKGSEFCKSGESDRKGLNEINTEYRKKYGIDKYDVEGLQAFADRMLRYEIEYKKQGLNYIYKTRLYKSRDFEYKRIREGYLEYKNIQEKIKRLAGLKKKPSPLSLYLTKLGFKNYNDAMAKMLKDLKKNSDKFVFYEKSQTQSSEFCLEITPGEMESSQRIMDYEIEGYRIKGFTFEKNALFSEELVNWLGVHFLKFVDEFTLKAIPEGLINSELIIKNIVRKNQELKDAGLKGMVLSFGFKEFLRYLDNNSIDQIKEMGIFDRVTMYRYKKQLEKIGYVRQSLMKRNIPFSSNFEGYYCEVFNEVFERNLKCRYFS